jgi:hypothetical protein
LAENIFNALTTMTGNAKKDGKAVDEWVVEKNEAVTNTVLANASNWDAADNIEDATSNFVAGIMGYADTASGAGGDSWINENYDKIFAGSGMSYNGNINTTDMVKAVYGGNGN